MNNTGRNESAGREGVGRRPLSTADLAAAGQRSGDSEPVDAQARAEALERGEALERDKVRGRGEARERDEMRERAEARERDEVPERAEARERDEVPERAEAHERDEVRQRAEAHERDEARQRAEARERTETREPSEQVIGDNEPTGTFAAVRMDAQDSMTNPAARSRGGPAGRSDSLGGPEEPVGRAVGGTGSIGRTVGRGDPIADTEFVDRAEPVDRPESTGHGGPDAARQSEALEPLFTPDRAETYRTQWLSIQSSFVDDPRQAVRSGDELVAQVMTNLANTFAEERHRMEAQLDETGEGATENLRVALRRYRSFFERLLAL
jgi:flagellar biosynthesis GTPase FlhF